MVLYGYFCLNSNTFALRTPLNDTVKSMNCFFWLISPISSLVYFSKGYFSKYHHIGEFLSLSVSRWISAGINFLSFFQKLKLVQIPLITGAFSLCLKPTAWQTSIRSFLVFRGIWVCGSKYLVCFRELFQKCSGQFLRSLSNLTYLG